MIEIFFQAKNLKAFFTECNSTEISFNDAHHRLFPDSKSYDNNDFNKLTINKNSVLPTLHLNIVFLSKHFNDLHKFSALLNHYLYNSKKLNIYLKSSREQ